MNTPFLTTSKLSKNFGETRALQDVSLEVVPGHIYTILGENGSGKSTLVKTIAGIVSPDSGEMRVEDKLVSAFTPTNMLKLGVAIVLQEVLIIPNRSVLDNILLGHDTITRYFLDRATKVSKVETLLAQLTNRSIDMDAMAGDLPLHEQQIIVIARGLARDPRLLILDEATAALDLADRDMLFATIKKFSANGGAVLFVSHRMPEIVALSDVVYVMHNGQNTAKLTGADINPATLLNHLTLEENLV